MGHHLNTCLTAAAVENLSVDELLDGAFLDQSKAAEAKAATKAAALPHSSRGEPFDSCYSGSHLERTSIPELLPQVDILSPVLPTGEKESGKRKAKKRKKQDEGAAFQARLVAPG